MGNVTGIVVAGFVKEVEDTTEIDSPWKLSDSQLIVSLIVAYSRKDIKDLQLKEVFKVGTVLKHSSQGSMQFFGSSVDSELQLVAMEGNDWVGVVDMTSNKEIWSLKRNTSSSGDTRYGFQTNRWLNIGQQKYLSVQTDRGKIQMFKVLKDGGAASYQFEEDKKYELIYCSYDQQATNENYPTNGPTISFCDFDRDSKHIFLIVDNHVLQKRAVDNINIVLSSITLPDRTSGSGYRNFRLSAHGTHCVIGGGDGKKYFYVVDMDREILYKLQSEYLRSSYVPCFINGGTETLAVSDLSGHVEIWDLQKKIAIKQWEVAPRSWIRSSVSSHNVLAIGTEDKSLRLYDVQTWECFDTLKFPCHGNSLHLTADLKYVTFAGQGSLKQGVCVVSELSL